MPGIGKGGALIKVEIVVALFSQDIWMRLIVD